MICQRSVLSFMGAIALSLCPVPGSAQQSWNSDDLGVSLNYPDNGWVEIEIGQLGTKVWFAIGSFVDPEADEGDLWRTCLVYGRQYPETMSKPLVSGDIERQLTDRGAELFAEQGSEALAALGYVLDRREATPILDGYPGWEYTAEGRIESGGFTVPFVLVSRTIFTKDASASVTCEIYTDRLPDAEDMNSARSEIGRILAGLAPLPSAALPVGQATPSREQEDLHFFGQLIGYLIFAYLLYRFVKWLLRRKRS